MLYLLPFGLVSRTCVLVFCLLFEVMFQVGGELIAGVNAQVAFRPDYLICRNIRSPEARIAAGKAASAPHPL